MPADHVWDPMAHRSVLEADLDAGEVERIEHALNFAAHERGVDLEGVAVQADGRGLGDRPSFGPEERFVQPIRGRQRVSRRPANQM